MESFKILDPHGTGYMQGHNLARLVLQLPGIGYVSGITIDFNAIDFKVLDSMAQATCRAKTWPTSSSCS